MLRSGVVRRCRPVTSLNRVKREEWASRIHVGTFSDCPSGIALIPPVVVELSVSRTNLFEDALSEEYL